MHANLHHSPLTRGTAAPFDPTFSTYSHKSVDLPCAICALFHSIPHAIEIHVAEIDIGLFFLLGRGMGCKTNELVFLLPFLLGI